MILPKHFGIPVYLLVAFSYTGVKAQCQLNVYAGPDTVVCSSDPYTLHPAISGNVLSFNWSPEQDLLLPSTLHPVVNAVATQDFSLTVRGFDESENLVVNGDFSAGDTGFTSQYESQSTGAGGYLIGTIGTQLFPEAKPCEDRSGTGNMMLIKVSDTENVNIWCQEIAVEPNVEYHFRAFATGLRTNNPPVIYLTINDKLLSSGTLGSFACSWQLVKASWFSENNAVAKICLSVSEEDIGNETDFALDDIGFYRICEVTDDVRIGIVPFEVVAGNAKVEMPCNESIQLTATVETTVGSLSYLWSTPEGNILSGEKSLSATVNAPGIYHLEVTREEAGMTCTDAIAIEVEEVSKEKLSIAEPEILNCSRSQVELKASHESPEPDFWYQWSTSDGNIVSGADSPVALVNAPGSYTLRLEDKAVGCSTAATVEVKTNQPESFVYDLIPPDCSQPFAALVFQSVSGGTDPYVYSVNGGNQFFEENTFSHLESGGYELVVRDANGCEVKDSVQITAYETIALSLPAGITLTKGSPALMPITVNLSPASMESVVWSPADGLSCTECLQPDIIPIKNTVYQVEIVDKNGCKASASIEVFVVEEETVYIPSGFSPNGDGHNEVFLIFGQTGKVSKVKSLRIFDRNGALVYQKENFPANDPSSGWNGRFKGELLNPGVYIYSVEIEFTDSRSAILSGTITLLR